MSEIKPLAQKDLDDLKKIIRIEINKYSDEDEQEGYYFEVNMEDNGNAVIQFYRKHDNTQCEVRLFTLKKYKNGYVGYCHSSLNHQPSKNNCIWSINLTI